MDLHATLVLNMAHEALKEFSQNLLRPTQFELPFIYCMLLPNNETALYYN